MTVGNALRGVPKTKDGRSRFYGTPRGAFATGELPMRIAEVIGTVTLSRADPSIVGQALKLVVPLGWDDLAGRSREPLEEIVALDQLGAGLGARIAISEGREAAMPFHPEIKPIDAYNAAIIDRLEYNLPSP
jgi:ethanolamine utilization protein EutN